MTKNNQTKRTASAEGADLSAANGAAGDAGAGVEIAQGVAPDSALSQLEDLQPSATMAPKIVQARVLAFCGLGEPNDVIEIDEDVAATMLDVVDVTPEAVAYALAVSE